MERFVDASGPFEWVNKNMAGIVRNLEHSLNNLNLEQVTLNPKTLISSLNDEAIHIVYTFFCLCATRFRVYGLGFRV